MKLSIKILGLFGTGVVCRDEKGMCIVVLVSLGVRFVSPHTCELMALVNSLHFGIQVGFNHIHIEGRQRIYSKPWSLMRRI